MAIALTDVNHYQTLGTADCKNRWIESLHLRWWIRATVWRKPHRNWNTVPPRTINEKHQDLFLFAFMPASNPLHN